MHVAVLGAGYAGITVARRLERTLPDDVRMTVVDERDTHLVRHLVHRLVRYPSLVEELTIPLGDLLDRAEHRRASVTDLDVDAGEVRLDDGSLSCDFVVVCLGSGTAYHGLPGVETHATPLKDPRHAERIRSDFLEVCEADGRAVVAGAGLSGIQAAGELAELARDRDASVEIRLLEQLDTVAPGFPERFQRAVADELAKRDVRVETGRAVAGAEAETVTLADGEELAYDQLVWTGGIAGRGALGGQRPRVRATLRLGDRAFGLGDSVRVVDSQGRAVPASAQTAVRQADVAAANVATLVDHDRDETAGAFKPRLERYRYGELGWLVSVGDGTVAQFGPTVVRGRAAKALKTSVGAGYLASVGAIRNASEYVWENVGSPATE